jgi:hypothetical protein
VAISIATGRIKYSSFMQAFCTVLFCKKLGMLQEELLKGSYAFTLILWHVESDAVQVFVQKLVKVNLSLYFIKLMTATVFNLTCFLQLNLIIVASKI